MGNIGNFTVCMYRLILIIEQKKYLKLFSSHPISSNSNSILLCIFQEQKVFFKCKEGHSGQFVYIRDDRPDKEYFGLCEVEVFHYKGN